MPNTSNYRALCTGFESGISADFVSIGALASVQNGTVITGSWSLKMDTTAVGDYGWYLGGYQDAGATTTAWSFYCKVRMDALPATGAGTTPITLINLQGTQSTPTFQLKLSNLGQKWNIKGNAGAGANANSKSTFAANTTYDVCVVYVPYENVYLLVNGVMEAAIPVAFVTLQPGGNNRIGGGAVIGAMQTPPGANVFIDDLVFIYSVAPGAQTPIIDPGTIVKNVKVAAEGNYADSTTTGVAHPNAYQNVDDYNDQTDYNTLGNTAADKRDTYKLNTSITLTGSNVFLGFTWWCLYTYTQATNRTLLRDNATDINVQQDGFGIIPKTIGFWLYRPSDDTVLLTKAMLENTSGNNIEFGQRALANTPADVFKIYSVWVSYFEGPAMSRYIKTVNHEFTYNQAVKRAGFF